MAYGSLAVDKIENSDGFTLGGSGATMKNRIINGAMVIDQRNAGASVSSAFSVDRWFIGSSQSGKFTAQQNAGSVTPPAGFTNYLGLTSSSAYSVTSSDYFYLIQTIEGFNAADLAWGTANAKTATLSFWARSSLTGTFGASIKNYSANRSYPFTYTISSANTWTYITVTVPGDTSGTWYTNNDGWGWVWFTLGSGSTRLGTANTWSGANYDGATGSVSVVGTNGATLYITGVQFEVGSQATSFDYRQYGTELALCQRYYYLHSSATNGGSIFTGGFFNSAQVEGQVYFPVSMRTAPALSHTTGSNYYRVVTNNGTSTLSSLSFTNQNYTCGLLYSGSSSGTTGDYARVDNNSASAMVAFSAEL